VLDSLRAAWTPVGATRAFILSGWAPCSIFA
jgi:hypothetical protein